MKYQLKMDHRLKCKIPNWNSLGLWVRQISYIWQEAPSIIEKKKINKLDFINMKNLGSLKDTVARMKIQTIDCN